MDTVIILLIAAVLGSEVKVAQKQMKSIEHCRALADLSIAYLREQPNFHKLIFGGCVVIKPVVEETEI